MCPNSFRKLASMKKITSVRNYFSKQARAHYRAFWGPIGDIGASKWKLRSVWRACLASLINCRRERPKDSTNSSSRFRRSGAEPCQNLQQWNQNLCSARRLFRQKIQGDFSASQTRAHGISWSQKLARLPKHEILATTNKFCSVLRNAELWHFSRNLRQRTL